MLVAYLPPESHLKTAVREETPASEVPAVEGFGPWANSELLLASIADGIRVLAWQNLRIHGDSKAPPPEPIPRPGVKQPARALSAAGIAYLSDLRERRRNR